MFRQKFLLWVTVCITSSIIRSIVPFMLRCYEQFTLDAPGLIADTYRRMNIYFSGIGGVGIGPLAMLSQDAGHNVFGSDAVKSPMFDDLAKRGVKVSLDQSGKFIDTVNRSNEIDLLVYSSGIPQDHPELKYAREYGISSVKRHELLNQLIEYKNMKLIGISGTHGKTTTTGMFIWVFKQLGVPISYSVGTRLTFGPPAKYAHDSEFFIYEADEFDRNMLKFKPYLAVITSLDYDHPDTYPTKDDYRQAFEQYIAQSKSTIGWKEDKLVGKNINSLEIISPDIKLAGDHNKANATLVLESIQKLLPDIDKLKIVDALNSFPGTQRRFEKLSDNLYTDYAHHPTEIARTIELAKEVNDNVVIVYQPHQNIRQHQIHKDGSYGDAFDGAKKVYWLPTYLSREDEKLKVLSPTELIESINDASVIEESEMNDVLKEKILTHGESGDLVIGMSAGDLDDWLRQLTGNN